MRATKRPGVSDPTGQSGLYYAFRYADHIARAVGHRAPEAEALASWFDRTGSNLGVSGGTDYADVPGRNAGVSALSWQRLRSTLARKHRTSCPASESAAEMWLNELCSALGFDTAERDVLALALFSRADERISRLVEQISMARGGPPRLQCNYAMLSLLLARDPGALSILLRPGGRLRSSGVLQVDRDGDMDALSQLAALVQCSIAPGVDPFAQLLGPRLVPTLPWTAFDHLGPEATVAESVLRAAVAGREPGINILLYGPPGTGKTTFAAALAARVGATLRSVTEQDHEGAEPNRNQRVAGLQLAQRLAPAGASVLLFDEAEDIFVCQFGLRGAPVTSRVFIHRLLEMTPLPVIWTANRIDALGPAVLRRMTMCLKFDVPGGATRARLWRSMGDAEGIALADGDVAALARIAPATPAVAATTLRATRFAGGDAGTARLIVEGIARAIAGDAALDSGPERPGIYNAALVSADYDLMALADTLARPGAPRAVSFLLSGPSGSGKSAWARHLAERMGLEVLQKRASDLLGMFVGETETKIAAAFAEAKKANAFLIFDEADGLLGERRNAVQGWEVNQVNEMLTWMEQHPLPFACTTNLPERLDRASLRRFLIKLRFDWMTLTQTRLAFELFYALPPPPGLDRLETLTPADFALVRRRASLVGKMEDAAALLDLLAGESEGRDSARPIGFCISPAA